MYDSITPLLRNLYLFIFKGHNTLYLSTSQEYLLIQVGLESDR